MNKLTTEQKFDIAVFVIWAKRLSETQTKQQLVEMYRLMLINDNKYLKLIGERWRLI